MDALASFLQILSKPIHFFFMGIAILFFAPSEFVWIGYVLFAGTLASAIEFTYNISLRKFKKENHLKNEINKKEEKRILHLLLYNDLHKEEKRMVNHCISRNEYVYELPSWDNDGGKYITALVLKGFGQKRGRSIVFDGDTFFTIRGEKGKKLIAAYKKKKK